MTTTTKQDVLVLERNIKANTPVVKQQLSRSGTPPDPAVVYSAAKYYATIEKLAKE